MDVITFPVNLSTTSGLSFLLDGIISLPDAASYDKKVNTGKAVKNSRTTQGLTQCFQGLQVYERY